jgi:hypothetical protein
VPRGAAPDAGVVETISVTAYFEPIGSSKPRELIGRFSVPVKFKKTFNLMIAPDAGEVPVDNTIGLSASTRENLPTGTTVDWEWSHAGTGALRSGPTDANPRESSALLDTGSSEGEALVTVRARVNVPGSSGKAPVSVLTDPVSATLKVKKGLKTVTLIGGWTVETVYEDYICGRCGPGGSNTVNTAYNVTAWAVIPKVSGAKSYSVLFEKPTPDVPRGVPFPHTRTLHPATPGAGWSDRGGSWWSGLSSGSGTVSDDGQWPANVVSWMQSRFGDMKVTVTVTL